MGTLFTHRQTPETNPQVFDQLIQNRQDPAEYAEEMLKRSGGNAKAAFYLACKEKGIDPDSVIKQIEAIKNPQSLFQNMVMSNPRAKGLMSLFSLVK